MEPVPYPEVESIEEELLHDDIARCQHCVESSPGGQLHPAVERIARFHRLQVGQERAFTLHCPHHRIEVVNSCAVYLFLSLKSVNRRREGLGKWRVGVNDDVGGMKHPRVVQERRVDAPAETAERNQSHHGENHTKDEDD